ncbi:MAG: response regulator, partial [Pseudomonadales bacterium]|nr:response regulator [Pseudomonadales bacterium]
WRVSEKKSLGFGYTSDTLWLHLKIKNSSEVPLSRLVEVAYALLDDVSLYQYAGDKLVQKYESGDQLPFDHRPIPSRNFLFPLEFQAQQTTDLYLRVKASSSLQVPLVLWTEREFFLQDTVFLTGQGAFFGILAVMFLYNLFLYVGTREVNYLFYIGYVFSAGLTMGIVNGLAYQYLWPTNVWLQDVACPVAINALALFILAFSYHFLSISQMGKISVAVFRILPLFGAILGMCSFFLPYASVIVPSILVAMLSFVCSFTYGVVRWRQGDMAGRYFTIAWSMPVMAVLVLGLSKLGILPRNFLIENVYQFAVVLEVILLSFALAERINQDRKARYAAQQLAFEKDVLARLEHEEALKYRYEAKLKEVEADQIALKAKTEIEAKSNFLSTMSHEIRTPMNGVIGMTQLLLDTPLNSKQLHYLNTIRSSGNALLTIINDILDYSKIEAGKLEIEKVDFSLQSLLDECLSIFALTASKKDINLTAFVEPETPQWVRGDPVRVKQIVLNLLGNAFKFTNDGEIHVKAFMTSRKYNNDENNGDNNDNEDTFEIRFEVQDTGIGIAKENQDKLFKSFAQEDASTTRKYGGSGLGLTINKKLVELMDGDLGLNSELNKGSLFWFTVTFTKSNQVLGENDLTRLEFLRGRKALVIDGNVAYLDFINSMLGGWGMWVCDASSSEVGKEQLIGEEPAFELVLIDMSLPDCNGLELIANFENYSRLNQLKVILCASSQNLPKGVANLASSTLLLEKPFTARQLQDAVLTSLQYNGDSDNEIVEVSSNVGLAGLGLAGLKVLVAEDNPVNQMVIKGMLEKLGIKARVVQDGLQAVDLVVKQKEEFDVILMDCEMPELDGYEATKQIVMQFQDKSVCPHIVGLSAHAMDEKVNKAFEAGMDEYITKPFQLNDLQVCLCKCQRRHSSLN